MTDSADRRSQPVVDVMVDSSDDVRVQSAIRRRCRPGSGRLLVSPPPSTYSARTLALHLIEVLTPFLPPGPWRWVKEEDELGQLELFPFEFEWLLHCAPTKLQPPRGEQLDFFPEFAPQPRTGGLGVVSMRDLVTPLRRGQIREVWVLRAQALRPERWWELAHLASLASVGLCLVVHGRSPTGAELGALRGCRVRYRAAPALRGGPSSPWWSRPSYRAKPRGRRPLLGGMTPPRSCPPDPPNPSSSALAGPAHVPDREFFEKLRAAVATLVGGAPRSFLEIAPLVCDDGRLRIEPARLVEAFRTVLDRASPAPEMGQVPPSPAPSSSWASWGPKGSPAPSSLRR